MPKLKEWCKTKLWVIVLTITVLIFAIPSIIYICNNNSILQYKGNWTWLARIPQSNNEKIYNSIIFVLLMTIMFLIYFYILKKDTKIFKNIKSVIIFIFVISIIFALIIPFTSLDVYSYIASGWIDCNYNENPYYSSVNQITEKYNTNDEMFAKVANCWRGEPIVYGPLWALICKVLTFFSNGNITAALIIFKLANLILHILNCLIIWKITNKKKFVLLYGLNPFILFEALSNVHNDIFIIFFVLLAMYFIIKKKNIDLSIACIALATLIKYFTILLAPFIVIYGLREKEKISEKLKFILLYALEFILIIVTFYLIYIRDMNVLSGLAIQQQKYNRSILFLICFFLGGSTANIVKNIMLILFIILYFAVIIDVLRNNKKPYNLNALMRQYNAFLLIFTFVLITNFNPWYIMWLFPTFFCLRGKQISLILNLSYASQIANFFSFALYSERLSLGVPYFVIMLIITIINMTARKRLYEREKI